MSINSTDVSNQTISSLQFRQDQRASSELRARQQSEGKTVQNSSGTNATQNQKGSSDSSMATKKIEPSDIEQMNKNLSQLNLHLQFEMSDDGRDSIVRVVDQSTGNVVRQIPTEEYLKMSKQIHDVASKVSDLKGVLFNGQA